MTTDRNESSKILVDAYDDRQKRIFKTYGWYSWLQTEMYPQKSLLIFIMQSLKSKLVCGSLDLIKSNTCLWLSWDDSTKYFVEMVKYWVGIAIFLKTVTRCSILTSNFPDRVSLWCQIRQWWKFLSSLTWLQANEVTVNDHIWLTS